jgi:hypothetical protein
MGKLKDRNNDSIPLDDLIEEILIDAYGVDGRFEEAGRIFDRMLWLNPSDNQGIRGLIEDVRADEAWKADRNA